MRRSKSDPSKYARNYRSISQRRMTKYDNDDNTNTSKQEQEMKRLRAIVQESEQKLASQEQSSKNNVSKNNKNGKRKRNDEQNVNPTSSILSPELQQELLQDNNNSNNNLNDTENPLFVVSSKKKAKKIKKPIIVLTPEEIKQAKLQKKNALRKLQQLQVNSEKKKNRQELYKKLDQYKVQETTMNLLSKSGTLSRKQNDKSKKQLLKHLLQKERAGIELTPKEHELLYPSQKSKNKSIDNNNDDDDDFSSDDEDNDDDDNNNNNNNNDKNRSSDMNVDKIDIDFDKKTVDTATTTTTKQQVKVPPTSGFSFAAQMMASLSSLKKTTMEQQTKMENESKVTTENNGNMNTNDDHIIISPLSTNNNKPYIPSGPTVLKTAAALGMTPKPMEKSTRHVMPVIRPKEIQEIRQSLPVNAMEFEIMDAIRNYDVTILCGETGSGKSTQVPQFLYEAGMTVCSNNHDDKNDNNHQQQQQQQRSLMIGITQPRRVAAVSTAKRVCFEMGQGDGQTITGTKTKNNNNNNTVTNNGNLVAFQTRFETSGLGTNTKIKFMTDGILLSEIQNDLLLRNYSVIVLDESHERNLNTDVLIGLLSVTLPLRRQTRHPLKLVLMSATLRLKDFTENGKLFQKSTLKVVKVPGRTFPVTIHHSKETELDDYETVAWRKICKMHKKLPPGGILVFLTGKAEIIRMVKRLERSLNNNQNSRKHQIQDTDDGISTALETKIAANNNNDNNDNDIMLPREIDDEEIDGDHEDDYDELESDSENDDDDDKMNDNNNNEELMKAHILPLYSMLSSEDQAKIFAPVPEGHRLIVIATNVAETSITIPGISYVVDSGRQKCRNYNAKTGVASYDIMWISKAAADQRAGRAGRTGPGHCYRLYSSAFYNRQMDEFALPEILIRPLEDVVLSMKAMKISNVCDFPFPTSPNTEQLLAATKLLANLGCLDISMVERDGGDGVVTKLGMSVSKLPVGVRYGKMLLVAAQAGVLDWAIAVVAVLSESSSNSPFQLGNQETTTSTTADESDNDDNVDGDNAKTSKKKGVDKSKQQLQEEEKQVQKKNPKWNHSGGDVLAGMLAIGAYTYAGRGAGGESEKAACKRFCDEQGLNYEVMTRIQRMRLHLARLAKNRLSRAGGVAAETGTIASSMSPPNKLQERLLIQTITSGLLDHVAILAPPGTISGDHPYSLRSAYLGATINVREPLFVDRNSALFSRDSRLLPKWVCYDSLVRKTMKDGSTTLVMKNITPVDPTWLGTLATGSKLLQVGAPLSTPPPTYNAERDMILCSVGTKFGNHGWEIPPISQELKTVLKNNNQKGKQSSIELLVVKGDSYSWFARYLLEGKVFLQFQQLKPLLNESPSIITTMTPSSKVSLLVAALRDKQIDQAMSLQTYWAKHDKNFLFKPLKMWLKRGSESEGKKIWMQVVKECIEKL